MGRRGMQRCRERFEIGLTIRILQGILMLFLPCFGSPTHHVAPLNTVLIKKTLSIDGRPKTTLLFRLTCTAASAHRSASHHHARPLIRIRRFLALSDHFAARFARQVRSGLRRFSIPAPHWMTYPVLVIVIGIRSAWYFAFRVFICEPLFKAYCNTWGTDVHTGAHLHWVTGTGKIILGDRVRIDGKCSFHFASRYDDHPTLTVGSGTGIGHGCAFVIGKSITIDVIAASDKTFVYSMRPVTRRTPYCVWRAKLPAIRT